MENNTAQTKKPIYKKWWFYLIAVFAVLFLYSGIRYAVDPNYRAEAQAEQAAKEAELEARQAEHEAEWEASHLDGTFVSSNGSSYYKFNLSLFKAGTGSGEVGSVIDGKYVRLSKIRYAFEDDIILIRCTDLDIADQYYKFSKDSDGNLILDGKKYIKQ